MERLIAQWLKLLKIPVSEKYLQKQLLSHPDYPSLLSITDTLSEFGIEHAAVTIRKEDLIEVPLPFITHLEGNEFVVVENLNTLGKKHPEFFKRRNGVILAAEKKNLLLNKENEKYLIEEKAGRWVLGVGSSALGFLIVSALLDSIRWLTGFLIFTSLTGIFLAVLILQKERGQSNKIIDQFCKAGKITDCNAVLQSDAASIGLLKFSDAGLIYFLTQFLVFALAFGFNYAGSALTIWSLIAATAILVTVFSVYYQWRVVKKWCTLCLAMVLLLWIQAVVLLPAITAISFNTALMRTTFLVSASFALIGTVWLLLRRLIEYKDKSEKELYPALRFKRNPEVFWTLLERQRKVDITPFEHELQLGNPDAPLQVMVGCNPYCGPCARAHKVLHDMVEKYGESMGLTVRFTIDAAKKEDKKTKAVEYLLRYILTNSNEATANRRRLLRTTLKNWYEEMDYEKFTAKHFLNQEINVDDLLQLHKNWDKKASVQYTPTIFVNGYEMPKEYLVNDLPGLLTGLLGKVEEIQKERTQVLA